jgi:3-phenylpropionate/trans-cinnamate dioxygenase alpha subunit
MAIDERELGQDYASYVSVERGEIDRRIFSDPDIYEAEMELIFGRAWLFMCHESQIPQPGDFFEAPIARDNVLIVRQKDGSIRGLLNTCTHRGNAVCRAEEGNVRNFMCTYHGWTFDLGGKLIGVPGLEDFYHGDLDTSKHGLRQVAQLESYKGFVFATLDPEAPPLTEYLGATGRLGIDLLAEKGDDIQVVPGIQKFLIECNWKFTVDNLFDWYHPQLTHISAMVPGVMSQYRAPDPKAERPRTMGMNQVMTSDGKELRLPDSPNVALQDQIAVLGEYGHAIAGPTTAARLATPLFDETWRERPEAIAALGPVGKEVGGHPNIFPSMWVTTGMQVSLRIPRGPELTEIWWFSFVDRAADEEKQHAAIARSIHVFGPSGLLEQEDGENWAQSTMGTRGLAARRVPQLLKMDLARGRVIKEAGLARIEGAVSEHAQLWTYGAWSHWMAGETWEELKASTEPPDFY